MLNRSFIANLAKKIKQHPLCWYGVGYHCYCSSSLVWSDQGWVFCHGRKYFCQDSGKTGKNWQKV